MDTKLRRVILVFKKTLLGVLTLFKKPARKTPPTTGKQAKSKANEVEIPLTDLSSDTLASMADMVSEGKIETNDPLGAFYHFDWLAKEKRNLEKPEQLKHKIIYIESHFAQRSIMSQMLEYNGYDGVITVETYEEGIEKIMAWRPDLILLATIRDRTQPDEGVEESLKVIATIRSMDEIPAIPIIVLGIWSRGESNEMKKRYYIAGANEYYSKPVDLGLLLIKISEYLKGTDSNE